VGVLPPLVGVAVKVTVVPAQIVVLLADMFILGAINGLTEKERVLLPTFNGFAHAALLVKLQDTTAPELKLEVEKLALFVPTFRPFTCHWYTGFEPPLVVVAVNVTFVPEQMVLGEVLLILIVGTTEGFIEMVNGVLLTAFELAHTTLLVMKQTTASLFCKELLV
jgi:hypothetical protein